MEKVLEEQGKVQDRIEAANGWDLDSRVELAMDALRLPAARRRRRELSGGAASPGRALPAAAAVARPAAPRRADEPPSMPSRSRGSSAS